MIPFYEKAAFELPDGPKNLATLFPAIDWNLVDQYYVTLKDDADDPIVTTPLIKICNCNLDECVRVHFENYLGKWDAVNFEQVKIVHSNTSAEFKKSLPLSHAKTDTGSERFNVRSTATFEATTYKYGEEVMPWLMELVDSAKAFREWTGTQGQPDSFLPIRILDGNYERKKIDNQFVYEFKVQFKYSNENILIRN